VRSTVALAARVPVLLASLRAQGLEGLVAYRDDLSARGRIRSMYLPKHFEETRVDVLHALIRGSGFATVVTLEAGALNANHLPLLIDPTPEPFGTLHGHVARANSMWRDTSPDVDALAVFHGPQIYISPSLYPTKQDTGKVVPTWNYAVVHAYGRLGFYEDRERLFDHVQRLTNHHEDGRPEPWRVSDAPADYVAVQLRGIVGVDMTITRLIGKWKVSQNRAAVDRQAVVDGLRAGDDNAGAMAALVKAAAAKSGT
jgi:transcriptional regulator